MSRRRSLTAFIVLGLAMAVALVLLVSPHASSAPDGLQRVAAEHRLARGFTGSAAAAHGPGRLAELTGVAASFVISIGVVKLVALRRAVSRDRPPGVG